MAFIKHGDGKIMSVIEEEGLTDAQKKAAKVLSKNKTAEGVNSDSSNEKKSGS